MSNQYNLAYATDLNEGLRVVPIQPVFISGDDKAHCFIISANRNGKEEKLTGATVRGYFIRPDDVTITLEGEVNEAGQAVLSLNSSCYNKQGRFQVVIRAIVGGVKSTVFCGEGRILLSATDSIVDEENIIPSLDDLLAQVAALEAAIDNANIAIDNANTAAVRAENAAERAENAQGPTGETGATPNLTIGTVETLAPGSNATATITGTAEDPVLNLGLPRGTDGQGSVRSVNGQSDVVVLTASDVGAATEDHTHTAADIGAMPDTYTAPVLSVNSKTGAVTLTAADVGALSSTGTAAKASTIESGAIRIRSCGQWSGEIEASGYTSTLSITPTAVSGYTFLYPVTYGSNSSYFCCYGLVYNSGKIQLYGRNINSKAITPTVDIIGVYIKN